MSEDEDKDIELLTKKEQEFYKELEIRRKNNRVDRRWFY